jgi:hypothetical protein
VSGYIKRRHRLPQHISNALYAGQALQSRTEWMQLARQDARNGHVEAVRMSVKAARRNNREYIHYLRQALQS